MRRSSQRSKRARSRRADSTIANTFASPGTTFSGIRCPTPWFASARALRRFAVAQGKPGLYHETITTAYLLLINERLDGAGRDLPWDAFADRNPDLLSWKPSVLDRYYHQRR